MGLFKYFRKKRDEKDYLRRLYEKSGVSSSSPKSKGGAKYPSEPIYREVSLGRSKVSCPYCGSNSVRDAGYAGRLECQKCGRIFT